MGLKKIFKQFIEFYKYKMFRYPALKYIILITILLLSILFFLGWILYGQMILIIALGAMTAILVTVQIETYHRLNRILRERKKVQIETYHRLKGELRERKKIEETIAIVTKIPSLFNKTYMNDVIIRNDSYAWTHGAENNFFGLGVLYYSFVYILHAKIAVCLGSGGGFVPRVIRQAQRDLDIRDSSRTILVDANLPEAGWGNPDYLHPNSFLKTLFSDIEIWVKKTVEAVKQFESENIKIDYLHIDAGKTYEETLSDFKIYKSLMSEDFIITIHDTEGEGVKKAIEEIRKIDDIELIDFYNFSWSGLAVIKKKNSNRKI